MGTDRLDVRLDKERRRRLAELAARSHTPISDLIRHLIDREYEAALQERRMQAIETIAGLDVEDAPEPRAVSRQLEGAHDPADLH